MRNLAFILAALALATPAHAGDMCGTGGHSGIIEQGLSTSGGTISGDLAVSGQIMLDDGSLASPSLTFSDDPDTGIYRAFSNQIRFVTGGALQLSMSAATSTVFSKFRISPGVLSLEETTTPSSAVGDGTLYTTSANQLRFIDGDGTDHEVSLTDTDLGTMGVTSGGAFTPVANVEHAIATYVTGSSLNNWTFTANDTAAITAYADGGGGEVDITSGTHGLVTGDVVTIEDSTNYNGVFAVTVADASTFAITAVWVADDGASNWSRGDRLVAGSGAAGEYLLNVGMSVTKGGGAAATTFVRVYINEVEQSAVFCKIKRSIAGTDTGSLAIPACVLTVADADEVFVTFESSNTNTITLDESGVVLHRL